jgi:Icc protein
VPTVDVLQVSDIHVTGEGDLHGQDPRANLDRVLADARARGLGPDLVVATGDLADDGDPRAYTWLRDRLTAFGAPAYCVAGNHDREPAFTRDLPGPGVCADRVLDVGEWRFVFLDSNALGRVPTPEGGLVDDEDRRHRARVGELVPDDIGWLHDVVNEAPERHVMVWLHHPPVAHPAFGGIDDREFTRMLARVAADAGTVRGVSAGHVHSAHDEERAGVRYFTGPSSWLALDLDAGTLAPPGYRHFRFHPDGRIDADVLWTEDVAGNRERPFPDWVLQVLTAGG